MSTNPEPLNLEREIDRFKQQLSDWYQGFSDDDAKFETLMKLVIDEAKESLCTLAEVREEREELKRRSELHIHGQLEVQRCGMWWDLLGAIRKCVFGWGMSGMRSTGRRPTFRKRRKKRFKDSERKDLGALLKRSVKTL